MIDGMKVNKKKKISYVYMHIVSNGHQQLKVIRVKSMSYVKVQEFALPSVDLAEWGSTLVPRLGCGSGAAGHDACP